MLNGFYHYSLNGKPAEVSETWSLEGELTGECRITSKRAAPGTNISVAALVSRGAVQNFSVDWSDGAAENISAQYDLQGDNPIVTRRGIGNTELEVIKVAIETRHEPPLLFPLMRIFTGPLIARLLERDSNSTVVLPDIADPADELKLLKPLISKRSAKLLGEEMISATDGEELLCRGCEYSGGEYTAESRFWLAADDLLERYQWQQSPELFWDVRLQRAP
ncbi:MAG: hypothetical protein ACJAYC_003647 [Halieaceae bacterium]|jgi:hypothetical protein